MDSILNFFTVIVDFVSMLFHSVITLITFIPDVLGSFYSTLAYVPSFIAPFLLLSISVTMVFAAIRLL